MRQRLLMAIENRQPPPSLIPWWSHQSARLHSPRDRDRLQLELSHRITDRLRPRESRPINLTNSSSKFRWRSDVILAMI
jgi:hypothetical protein